MRFGTVGKPLPNVEVKIAEDGEILMKGPSLMKGYYKDPELTSQAIDKDGWFHTGDIGEFVDDKFLRITDRKKEMFKSSSGKYVAPQVIENFCKESMFIEQLMVIGENQKFVSALISPDFKHLKEWCSKNNISFNDNNDLINIDKVQKKLQEEIGLINKKLGQIEQIKRFRLVSDTWSSASGELSPTLKLKRKFISDKYKDIINQIYLQ